MGSLTCEGFAYCGRFHLITFRNSMKDWQATYERLSVMVVPRSSFTVAEDPEFYLVSVTVMKKIVEEFKQKARENKYVCVCARVRGGGRVCVVCVACMCVCVSVLCCVCVCMCVCCVHACVYVCMYVHMYVCMHVRTYVRMYACMCVCMLFYMYG